MKLLSILSILVFIPFFTSIFENNSVNNLEKSSVILTPAKISDIKLSGYPGEKIDLCINERIKKQDAEHLIEPFRNKTETRLWQSEFWGKWMLSAIAAYKYQPEPELLSIIKNAVEDLLETQLPLSLIHI